ncbi:DUF5753 domain-containing protein [Streptomyces sp. NPDC085665]|uniref:DUF5753 domain-containing protein n=1 Tax=Streptomyces sp. NPDC085665 TaxID=3365735 RepID=UPI0037D4CC85
MTTRMPGELVAVTYLSAVRRTVGMNRLQAARAAGLPAHVLYRLERGSAGLDLHTATRLQRAYGITSGQDIEAVTRLLRAPEPEGKMQRDSGPGNRERLMACERASRAIRMWTAFWVPTVLQTPDYARTAARRERLLDSGPGPVRLGLRTLPRRGPRITLLIDEIVLQRPIGGPNVMAGQLAYLQRLIESRAVAVRVVPIDSCIPPPGPHLAELQLHRTRLYVDESIGVHYAIDSPDRSRHRAHLDALEAAAASPEQSYDWIGRARTALVPHQS